VFQNVHRDKDPVKVKGDRVTFLFLSPVVFFGSSAGVFSYFQGVDMGINEEKRNSELVIEAAIQRRTLGLEVEGMTFMDRLPDAADKWQAFLQAKREAAQRKQANHG
jgi:hypothetical protein